MFSGMEGFVDIHRVPCIIQKAAGHCFVEQVEIYSVEYQEVWIVAWFPVNEPFAWFEIAAHRSVDKVSIWSVRQLCVPSRRTPAGSKWEQWVGFLKGDCSPVLLLWVTKLPGFPCPKAVGSQSLLNLLVWQFRLDALTWAVCIGFLLM